MPARESKGSRYRGFVQSCRREGASVTNASPKSVCAKTMPRVHPGSAGSMSRAGCEQDGRQVRNASADESAGRTKMDTTGGGPEKGGKYEPVRKTEREASDSGGAGCVCGMGWDADGCPPGRVDGENQQTQRHPDRGRRSCARKKAEALFPASVRVNEGRQTRESFRERHKSEFGRSSVARWVGGFGEVEGGRRREHGVEDDGEVGKEEGKKECAAEQQNQGVGVCGAWWLPPWPVGEGWVTVTLAGARRMGRGPGRFSLVGCGHGKGGPHKGGPAQAGTGAEGR